MYGILELKQEWYFKIQIIKLVATIVEEDVAFGPENLGVEPQEIRKRVDEALKNVGM